MICSKRVEKTERQNSLSKAVAHTVLISCAGLILGAGIKLLDIYTSVTGNIFSQISVWVFLCTIISIYSSTAMRAAANVFLFCAGMLLTYYITAELTHSVYSPLYIYGWILFALFTPLMAFGVWHTKGKGLLTTIITICMIAVMLLAATILFDKIRISDLVFAILTGCFLIRK